MNPASLRRLLPRSATTRRCGELGVLIDAGSCLPACRSEEVPDFRLAGCCCCLICEQNKTDCWSSRRYCNKDVHRAAFVLPTFAKEALGPSLTY